MKLLQDHALKTVRGGTYHLIIKNREITSLPTQAGLQLQAVKAEHPQVPFSIKVE